MKKRETLMNMVSGLLLQCVLILSGFIIPRIILKHFGSDANGLITSLNQFLNYIALLEGGVTGVVTANLYKPIIDRDYEKVSSIYVTADRFLKRIGFIYLIYAAGLSVIFPLIKKTVFSFGYVCTLTLILSMSLFIQYMFAISLRTVLNADKKGYIVNNVQTAIAILNIGLVYLSVEIYPSVHLLKAVSGILFIIQPIVFGKIVSRNYNLNKKAKVNNELLKERWNGFAINFAAFIHTSTDVTVLTFFSNLSIVSVYSVYALICNGLKSILNACFSGIAHTVGQAYARKDFEELNSKMDVYEYIVFSLVCFIFTVAALLITPFVQLYTKGITDADYYQPVFGILLLVSEALYLVKYPHLDLAYSANKFKEITIPGLIEAGLNIGVSILLVYRLGLIGVAIGTIVGMTYRMAFHVYYTTKLIPGRRQIIFYGKLIAFAVIALLGFLTCRTLFPITEITIPSWIIHAIVYCIIVGIGILVLSALLFRKELKFFLNYLKR